MHEMYVRQTLTSYIQLSRPLLFLHNILHICRRHQHPLCPSFKGITQDRCGHIQPTSNSAYRSGRPRSASNGWKEQDQQDESISNRSRRSCRRDRHSLCYSKRRGVIPCHIWQSRPDNGELKLNCYTASTTEQPYSWPRSHSWSRRTRLKLTTFPRQPSMVVLQGEKVTCPTPLLDLATICAFQPRAQQRSNK